MEDMSEKALQTYSDGVEKIFEKEIDITLSSAAEEDITLPSATAELTLPSAADDEEISLPSATDETEMPSGDEEAEETPIHDNSHPIDNETRNSLSALSSTPLMSSTPKKTCTNASAMITHSYLTTSNDDDCLLNSLDESATQHWQLSSVLNFSGCGTMCATKLHGVTHHDILRAHSFFDSRNRQEQSDYIIQFLVMNCPYDKNGDRNIKNITFTIQGKLVCMKLWLEVLSVSISRFYRLRQQFIEFGGVTSVVKARRSLAPRTLEAIAWMENYFQRVGDKRPDKADAIYLPTCLTEKKLFEIYVEDVYQGDMTKAIGRSRFNTLFNTNFKHVTIPKSCRFTKCDFCTLIKIELARTTTSKEERQKLRDLLDQHINDQDLERQRYYSNRRLASDRPHEFLSLIADGMDQNKTNLPHLVRVPKSCQNLWNLRTHLTGVMIHGSGSFCFFDYLQWPHDCNLTISCILNALYAVSIIHPLPPKLMIQMDNCVRENKNKYMYGFLLLLIELNIFTEIELGFLMVGHTHEDIDQGFSRLSSYLEKNDALSMEDIMQATKTSNRNVTHVTALRHVFNIREWISPHLEPIKYHTEPHVFLFKKNPNKKAAMFYKQWSVSKEWEPDNHGCLLLKSIPTGSPNLVEPSLHKQDVPRLKKDIQKYKTAASFSEKTKDEWGSLLDQLETIYGCLPKETPRWILHQLQPVETRCPSSSVEVPVPESVSKHLESTKRFRKIVIGDKRTTSSKAMDRPSKKGKQSLTTTRESTEGDSSEKPLEQFTKGDYVLLKCEQYKDWIPQIGQVLTIDNTKVKIKWMDGSFEGKWSPWKYGGRQVRVELPRRSIIRCIEFNANMELQETDIPKIKTDYEDIEYV